MEEDCETLSFGHVGQAIIILHSHSMHEPTGSQDSSIGPTKS